MTNGGSLPPGRYPAEQSADSRRRWVIALSVVVVAAGVGIAWLGYDRFADPPVSGEATGYEILDDSTIDIQFTVTRRDPSNPVACVLRARSKDGSETGRREILIPPSNSTQVGVRSQVRTSQPPAIAEVFGCTENVPAYLKAVGN
ncbi:DUF4307 domain-containing protein [Williamsia sp. CHRR-6]|uniref:DUF4307 domain-containing protein n=1 Tax=Williamsia sp. CHRR-6 TaxID=2835871 RepID=UPI001BD9329E|nr:DUF4307 domain-containing protein [Williamsia sp. CHRR-6]MBT0566714.1 DUF4307 domain-containing protein [Williamsia sp. CHRR-6]